MKKNIFLFLCFFAHVSLFAADGINNQLSYNIFWTGSMSHSTWAGWSKQCKVEIRNHSMRIITITRVEFPSLRQYTEDLNGELTAGSAKFFTFSITGSTEPQTLPYCIIYYTLDGVDYVKRSDDGISVFNLSSYNIKVFKGNTNQLTTDSSEPVIWSSENTEIATVDATGLISGKKEGTTVINATSSDNTFMASCSVEVIANAINISQNSADLFVEDNLQLSYSNIIEEMPVKNVSWKSSDDKIVTVNSEGLITAESQGTAIITVTSDEGYGEASCIVTVKKRPLTITANNAQRVYGDENPTFTLSYSGFVNGDSQSKITIPTISCDAKIDSNVGDYVIKLSGGASNKYELTLIPGTLTINKAKLIASAGDYLKRPGEDNPLFVISYSGFKCNETKDVLIKEPTISCSATKDSPAGTYPVTLSGGQATNYDIELKDGVLKVSNTYALSVSIEGNATVMLDSEKIDQFGTYTIFEGETHVISFKADYGFQFEKITINGNDITNSLDNGTYTVSNIKNNISIVVKTKEMELEFSSNDINYKTVSFAKNTLFVKKSDYKGHIVIPSTVNYDGIDWTVVGIEDNAFYGCPGLLTVSIPNSILANNIGISLFSNSTDLAAIIWEAPFALTGTILGTIQNPNILVYVTSADYAPQNIKNLIVGQSAKEIVLTDAESGNNFYCPKEFTAEKISYTHRFGMESGYSSQAKGWETVSLPFAVSEITHESKGKLLPFGKWNSSSSEKPFWLCNLSSSGFTRATSIQANTPYIICMPNNSSEYEDEYNLSGNVTFSAANAKVSASNSVTTAKSNGKTFIPAFCAQDKSSTVYALNVKNNYHSEAGGYTEGSAFVSDLRAVSPFEAYMTTDANNAKRAFLIEFSETTGIDEIPSADDKDGLHKVFNLNGQLVKKANSQRELDETLKQLPTGVYIINGKKTVIKR